MWSETFFFILADFKKHYLTSYSNIQVEHVLYEELKSTAYAQLRQDYLGERRKPYPEIRITDCPIFEKNLGFCTKNNAIEFIPALDHDEQGHFKVCKNYILSVQNLREEFRRENTLAHRYYFQ